MIISKRFYRNKDIKEYRFIRNRANNYCQKHYSCWINIRTGEYLEVEFKAPNTIWVE